VITDGNMKSMREKLNANGGGGERDNVLLEWMLALELYDLKIVQAIVPLFESKAMYSHPEKASILKSLNGISGETNKACVQFLEKMHVVTDSNNGRKEKILKRNVSDVYESLCKFQALAIDDFQSADVKGSYTDWKLYMQCGAKIRSDSWPYVSAKQVASSSSAPPTSPAASSSTSAVVSSPPPTSAAAATATIPSNLKLRDYSIDQVCLLWTATFPIISSKPILENGIDGEGLMGLGDEEMKEFFKLNALQIRMLRKAMEKIPK